MGTTHSQHWEDLIGAMSEAELIGEAEAGWILERSGEAFAHALRELAADPERRRRMGREARRQAEAFPWEASTDGVLRLYRALLPEAPVIEVVAA